MQDYVVPQGMPLSVFHSKYSRRKPDGTMQSWTERVEEVVLGNFQFDTSHTNFLDLPRTLELAKAGIFVTSGRHLQHGDLDQPNKLLELFTNCSTAMFSFMLFRLLLRGSGVGRDYSSECCRVDWDMMPDIRLVLDEAHPDYKEEQFRGAYESLRNARHKYDSSSEDVRWFVVEDTREGWSKVVEILETAAWQRKHENKLFIFDFSQVRCAGTPIMGLQGRPASGPLALMHALASVASIKNAGMKPWKQALFIDHYLAACVQLGGARRAARMATKHWRDRDIMEFIDIKRGGFLWSTNNSLLVDKEFWEAARSPRHTHARRVFEAAVNAAYWDATGEPGFINVDSLNDNRHGMDNITAENYINRNVYTDLHPRTVDMINNVLTHVKTLKYPFLTNPCQPAFAPVITPKGLSTVGALKVGDQIWSEDGWVVVTNKFSTGIKPVLRYRTTAGVFYGTAEHRIVEYGEKVQVCEAECIDRIAGPPVDVQKRWDAQSVMDGLVIGDGSAHLTSAVPVYLSIGQYDHDYFRSEVGGLILEGHPAKYGIAYSVLTTILPEELEVLPIRVVPARYSLSDPITAASFLRGLYSANGSVVVATTGFRVTLKTASSVLVEQVQIMLSALGIPSFFTTNLSKNVVWANGTYQSKESYDVNITGRYAERFANAIGFIQEYKQAKLQQALDRVVREPRRQKLSYEIRDLQLVGDMDVYDVTVSGAHHTYWSGACNVSNCGEIVLATYGGYCVLGDVCLAYCESKDDALAAVELMGKFLVRCNLMKSDYQAEVMRTNRIGVALTGIHEFAWTMFGLTFRDLISYYDVIDGRRHNPERPLEINMRVHNFWQFIALLRTRAEFGAASKSADVGMTIPHTVTTIKPSGTVGKVMNCTEGAHLPALRHYLRWVQYKANDPELEVLMANGYPAKNIGHRYPDYWVVGFPTKQRIVDLMGSENVTTADETTPEENFKWLRLLERFWLGGDKNNNQVSYTLKYDPTKVSYLEYMDMVLEHQPSVRCCAVMPQSDWKQSEAIYGYVPEEPISEQKYNDLMSSIIPVVHERYDDEALACEAGACPIEPSINQVSALGK